MLTNVEQIANAAHRDL